jgi:uncharacterized membrane protein YcaP (DUF421 family)
MWQLTVSPLELVVRSVVVYILFLLALRFSGKRELGQFTIFDLVLVLLAANALQPAMTGPDYSVTAGIIIVGTMFVLNRTLAFGRQRLAFLRVLLDPAPTVLARDGKWIKEALDREGLDDDDLGAALREYGLEKIDEARLVTLEHDGSISVVPRQGDRIQIRSRRRRYRHRAPASQ